MKVIIWDWNGTLFNDAECSFQVLNNCLEKRGLQPIDSVDSYREFFTFPVRKVYESAGFDLSKDSFEDLSIEYTTGYANDYKNYQLHEGVVEILKENQTRGILNVLCSASPMDVLLKQVHEFQVEDYFEHILGLDNIYASSKVELAKKCIENIDARLDEVVWVGDTIHDYECAVACGVKCILISQGHQTKQRLETTEAIVVDNIKEVRAIA